MNFDWAKSIPGFKNYFNEDHRLIIDLIGIDDYFKLLRFFGKTGIYFSKNRTNNDQQLVVSMLGEENYNKLCGYFDKTTIYFSSSSINQLKKAWCILNKDINYNEAARTLQVSMKTIYAWRQEQILTPKTGSDI